MQLVSTVAAALLAHVPFTCAVTPQALNPYNKNIVDNNTVTLYYNGTGPVPAYDLKSPKPKAIPPLTNSSMIEQLIYAELSGIINGSAIPDKCSKCIASVELMHFAALTQPVSTVTNLLIELCEAIPAFQDTIYAATCCKYSRGTMANLQAVCIT